MSFFLRESLRLAWRYTTEGVIWRLLTADRSRLIGEERDLSKKEASFFCLDQQTGKILWEHVQFGERWWVGIECAHRDVLLLHGFATPDLPGHKGITAIEIETGKRLWVNEDLKFLDAVDGSVFASRIVAEGEMFVELKHKTGKIGRSWLNDQQAIRDARERSVATEHQLPEYPRPAGHLPPASVEMLKRYYTSAEVVGNVEAIERDDVLVFSVHVRTAESTPERLRVDSILQVVDKRTAKIVFREQLATGAPAVAPEAFFVHNNMLFYIKSRNILAAIRLHSPS